jgi:hypothetical protein
MVECNKPSCCHDDSHKTPSHFLLKLLGIILALLLIVAFSAPYILSTQFGKDNIVKPLVTKYLHADLGYEDLSLSWFGKQSISNVTLNDPQTNLAIQVQSLKTETPLWKLLAYLHELGPTKIVGLNATYTTPEDQKVSIENLNAELNIDPSNHLLLVQAHGDVSQNGQKGHILIETSSKKTGKDLLSNSEINLNQFKIKVDVTDLPVEMFDIIVGRFKPEYRGLLPKVIGNTIDIHIQEVPASIPTYHVTANSENLQVDLTGNLNNNRFILNQQGKATLKLTPEALELSPYGRFVKLQPNSKLELLVNELNASLQAMSSEAWLKDMSVKSQLNFYQVSLIGNIDLTNSSVLVTKPTGEDHFSFQAQADIGKSKTTVPMKALFKIPLDFKKILNSTIEIGPVHHAFVDKVMNMEGFTQQAVGDLFKIFIETSGPFENLVTTISVQSSKHVIPPIKLRINDQISLLDPVQIQLNVNQLVNSNGKTSAIKDLKGLKLAIHSFSFPLSKDLFSGLKSSGGIQLDNLAVQDKSGQIIASLEGLKSNWDIDGVTSKLKYNLSAQTHLGKNNETGIVTATGLISDWISDGELDYTNLKVKTDIQAKQIPTAILESLSNFEGLELILGPTLQVSADIDLQLPNINNKLNITVSSQMLKMNAELKIDKAIELKDPEKPIVLEWSLTPQSYAILRHHLLKIMDSNNDILKVNSPTSLVAKVSNLNIPLAKDKWKQTSAVFDLVLGKTTFVSERSKLAYTLDKAVAKLQTKDLSQQISFTLNMHGAANQQNSGFDVSASGIIETPLNIASGLPPAIIADIKTSELPADLICYAVCLGENTSKQLEALIGSRVNADINIHFTDYTGPLHAHIFGKNGKFDIDGQLNKGYLTLNRPLQAEVKVTSQFSRSIIQQFMPMLKDVLGADGPVTITIPNEGFGVPLKKWDLNQVSIRRAMIDLGRLHFKNQGQIGDMLAVLNYKDNGKPITIWFTPLYLSFNQSIAVIERMDMLVTSYYPMAIWGKIFFKEDNVRMTFAMSGKALANAFGVKAPENYLLLLPIKGRIADATIDKKKATAKVSSLVMHNSGPQGIIIGTVIDVLGGGSNDSDSAPPPTTKPLPWANNVPASPVALENDTPLLLKPVKTLGEGAQSLINSIFN